MESNDQKIIYNILLESFIETLIDLENDGRTTENEKIFINIMKRVENVAKDYEMKFSEIFENSKLEHKNNKKSYTDVYNYKKINQDFKENFVNNTSSISNFIDRYEQYNNSNENNINESVLNFFKNWDTDFKKEINQEKKIPLIKYSYFHFIQSLFKRVNREYEKEIESIADRLLGEMLLDKIDVDTEKAKTRFIDLLHEDVNASKELFWDNILKASIEGRVFLSYSFDDRIYTLMLFDIAKKNKIFLCVDWIINDKNSEGTELKNTLYSILQRCNHLLFLRSLNSEFLIKGSPQIRQWCSWEIGFFYHKNKNDENSSILWLVDTEYLTGEKDTRINNKFDSKYYYEPSKKNELFLQGLSVVQDVKKYFKQLNC